jgi:hypothetical protein
VTAPRKPKTAKLAPQAAAAPRIAGGPIGIAIAWSQRRGKAQQWRTSPWSRPR